MLGKEENKMSINIHKFAEQFNKEYKFLYDHNNMVAGYNEALKEGDKFIAEHPEFVGEFVKYRGDFISSDREVAAFMFALNEMIN